MILTFIQFGVSAAFIFIAAIYLVRFADQIAEVTKLGRLLVGSLFLAAATSIPELFIDISAIRNNDPDIGVGNVFGSCLLNLMILASGDIFDKGSSRVFSRESAAHSLSAAMSIMMTSIAGISVILAPFLKNHALGSFGIGTLIIGVSYLFGVRLIYFNDKIVRAKTKISTVESPEKISISKAFAGYFMSATVILIAAPYVADAAGEIAILTGLGNTFIGTTLVSLATTLPELVSTLTSIRMKAFDLAIGNIFGSNAFNMLILIPLDLFHPGPLLAEVSPLHVFTAFSIILITAITVMGQLYQVEKRKKLIEPDAFVVISIGLLSLFILYLFTGFSISA